MPGPDNETDWPRPARLTVGVISAGRVGSALGAALERAGHVVTAVAAISEASLDRARTRLPDTPVRPAVEVAAGAELLILAVPDTELEGLVRGLAASDVSFRSRIVLHTSGAQGIGVLAPLAARGAICLAIHPAMTFTGHEGDVDRLISACFGITAPDEVGFAIAQSLVLEIGGEPVHVPEANRTLYHAALAHGANHLVTLVNDAVAALSHALDGQGLLDQDAAAGVPQRILAPLLSAALDNALRYGDAALTGPVARGDADAVARHLRVLEQDDTRIAASYRALSLRTAQRIGASPELIEQLEELQ
ncbi:Rossmann-like and DUF2520 domain-containing protein [Tomitella biformata]|uniref:Rossmann-like and DUF2520 domain-containing protein n=1 Tax=Tomitella biformata TaxID=630403 RepID=UPI0004656730|nr:DUF2520 domain-containing protein [Tomitella biformata]